LLVVGEVMIDVATIDPAASVVRTSAVPKAVAKCASMPVISAAWTAASVVLKSPSKLWTAVTAGPVGEPVARAVGAAVGALDVGTGDGTAVGVLVGASEDGATVGAMVGTSDGVLETGARDGINVVGGLVGVALGVEVGDEVLPLAKQCWPCGH